LHRRFDELTGRSERRQKRKICLMFKKRKTMNASVKNRVQLLGNLGKDPQVMEVKSGKMARISLATTEFRKTGKNEYETETQWHNVVLWGKQAELAEKFLKKGSRVLIEGKIQNRSYQDKSGQKKYATDIVALDLVLLGGKPAA